MFRNVEKKIKTYAKIVTVIPLIILAILSLRFIPILLFNVGRPYFGTILGYIFIYLLIFAILGISIWIGGLFIYGFGKIIENTSKICEELQDLNTKITLTNTDHNFSSTTNVSSNDKKYCRYCNSKINGTATFCIKCGEKQ